MKIYELTPTNGRKSFYGKAKVIIEDNGTETLYSYDTPLLNGLQVVNLLNCGTDGHRPPATI